MLETTQMPLFTENGETENGFYNALNYIRQNANTQFGKGRLFERLVQAYLLEDPFYKKRFTEVYLWKEWAELRPEFDATDIGIDLVAHRTATADTAPSSANATAENTRITKKDIQIPSSPASSIANPSHRTNFYRHRQKRLDCKNLL